MNLRVLLIVLAIALWVHCEPLSSSSTDSGSNGHNLNTYQSVQQTYDQFVDLEVDQEHIVQPVQNQLDEEAEEGSGHRHLQPSEIQFWQAIFLALFLAICGAFCSGLGVGLLSISKLQLKMMRSKKNEMERKMASKILSVVEQHHLFLVTLLIANAIALESLPLVIHLLMPDWLAIITSTVLVLIVAEIIPQAFCTGVHKIKIAYYASPIILVLIKIFWIVGYPTAKFLDYLLGAEHDERIQHKDFGTFLNEDKFLNKTEKLLLTSTLDLRGTRVNQVMIPAKSFFMVEEREVINAKVVSEITDKDYSYILVYREKRNSIVGMIKVKEFAIKYLLSQSDEMVAGEVMKFSSNMLTVYEDTNLLEMLMLFQAKSTRIALVCNQKKKTDVNVLSIMYSKTDMIYKGKDAEVIGVIFLYHIFDEMAEIKTKIVKKQENIIANSAEYDPSREVEMNELSSPLLK